MIKIDYFLSCEDVKVDDRGRTTLVNLFERLDIPNVPAAVNGAKVTFRMHPSVKAIVNKKMEFKVSAELKGKEVWNVKISPTVTVEKNNGYAHVLSIDPMVFPEFGAYTIRLFIDNKEMAETFITVRNTAELVEP